MSTHGDMPNTVTDLQERFEEQSLEDTPSNSSSTSPPELDHPLPVQSSTPSTSITISPLPLTTFKAFPRLPVELQRMIWKHNLPGPRVVEIREGDRLGEDPSRDTSLADFTWTRKAPVNLHVNQEARSEALRDYQLVPIAELHGPVFTQDCDDDGDDRPKIFLNFKIDTIYIGAASILRHGFRPQFPFPHTTTRTHLVQHLAVDSIVADIGYTTTRAAYYKILHTYKRLSTFTLVRDWTTWNNESWEKWWLNDERVSRDGKSGLSLNERCYHAGTAMGQYDFFKGQIVTLSPTMLNFPELSHMAYFGKGSFVEPYGDYFPQYVLGPRQECVLKGPEAELVSDEIKRNMEQIKLAELENGNEHVFRYLN